MLFPVVALTLYKPLHGSTATRLKDKVFQRTGKVPSKTQVEHLMSAMQEFNLLIQTSAELSTQEGAAITDAERVEDFSSCLEPDEGCDGEMADFEAFHAPGAARPVQAPWPCRSTGSAPAQLPSVKKSRKLESELNEVTREIGTHMHQMRESSAELWEHQAFRNSQNGLDF